SAGGVLTRSAASAGTTPLSLHDALPIFGSATANVHTRTALVPANGLFEQMLGGVFHEAGHIHHQHEYTDDAAVMFQQEQQTDHLDRKSTRLNSSHVKISYAVFCLTKKER